MPWRLDKNLANQVLEAIPTGILVVSSEGDIELFNSQALQLLALDPEDPKLETVFGEHRLLEHLGGRTLTMDSSPLGRALRGECVQHDLLRCGKGPLFRGSTSSLKEGAIWLLQAEAPGALRPNIDFEQVLDSMQDMVLIKGDRSRLLWANKTFRELYNMSNQDLQDLLDGPQSDPDDTVQYVKDDHKVFTQGEPLRVSEPVTSHLGETTYYDTVKVPIHNEQGEVFQTVGVSRKILDQDQIERSAIQRGQRKERLEELRVLVQNIPLAVALLDVKERILAQSRAWESLFSYGTEQEIGHFYDESCESKLPLLVDLRRSAAHGESVQRLRVPFGPGEQRLNLQIQPWRHGNGEIGGTIVVLSDVTALIRSESELQERNKELAEFNYRLSHDFIAPLRSIQGLSRVARKAAKESKSRLGLESCDRILADSSHLIKLLLNIENFARTENNDDQAENIELEGLIAQLFQASCSLDPKPEPKLVLDLQTKTVLLPAARFGHILDQLLSNAVKYRLLSEDSDEIHVSSDSQDGQLLLSVINRGKAIAADQVKSIFDLFRRGGASHPGNGLGLYLAQKHAKALGGSVSYKHTKGMTCFQVQLPLEST